MQIVWVISPVLMVTELGAVLVALPKEGLKCLCVGAVCYTASACFFLLLAFLGAEQQFPRETAAPRGWRWEGAWPIAPQSHGVLH